MPTAESKCAVGFSFPVPWESIGAHHGGIAKSMLRSAGSRRLVVIPRHLILALLVSCQAVSFVHAQTPAQAPSTATGEHRKTSEPYTGDLSIFDSPGRD